MDIVLSSEFLASVAGIALSLGFSYIPGLREWFESLDGVYKRVIMAGMLLVVSVAIYALACAGVVGGVTCDQPGLIALVQAFISALVANQATYTLTH